MPYKCRRSPATAAGLRRRPPQRNKGRLYPADPPTVDEVVAVIRQTVREAPDHTSKPLSHPRRRRGPEARVV
jgi:hypothetical protein